MNKPCAEMVKDLSIRAISEVTKILAVSKGQCPNGEYETLTRAVANVIGFIEGDILTEIYAQYPDLDDLK